MFISFCRSRFSLPLHFIRVSRISLYSSLVELLLLRALCTAIIGAFVSKEFLRSVFLLLNISSSFLLAMCLFVVWVARCAFFLFILILFVRRLRQFFKLCTNSSTSHKISYAHFKWYEMSLVLRTMQHTTGTNFVHKPYWMDEPIWYCNGLALCLSALLTRFLFRFYLHFIFAFFIRHRMRMKQKMEFFFCFPHPIGKHSWWIYIHENTEQNLLD